MVARQNLAVNQGEDFRLAIELKDEFDSFMDLTGFSFKGQAKKEICKTEPDFEFEFTLRDQSLTPGYVDLLIPSSETALLQICEKTTYLYDIEMTQLDGDIKRIIEGSITLSPEVTK